MHTQNLRNSDDLEQITVISVTPARDEEKYLANSLSALGRQTKKVEYSVVVNDGSTDRTKEIAEEFPVNIIDLPDRGYSVVDKPELAETLNAGIQPAIKNGGEWTYLLLIGPDTIMPANYVEKLIRYMIRDNVAIASGIIRGEGHFSNVRGSGRIIRKDLLLAMKNVLGFYGYPVVTFWESYPLYFAERFKFGVKLYHDLILDHERPTQSNYKTSAIYYRGKIMRSLGNNIFHVIKKVVGLTLKRRIFDAIKIIRGYISKPEIKFPKYTVSLQMYHEHLYRRFIKKEYIKFESKNNIDDLQCC